MTICRIFLFHEHLPKSYTYLKSYQVEALDEEPAEYLEQTALAHIKSHLSFQRLKSFEMAKPKIYLCSRSLRGQSPQVTRKQIIDLINLGYLESETSEVFSLLLEGDTLQGITHGNLVIVLRTLCFNFVMFEQISMFSYEYFGSGSVVGFPEDSAQTIYAVAHSLIARRLDGEDPWTVATVKNLSLYEMLRVENPSPYEANHEQGYKKALEKGQLEPDLLRSSSSAIRSAEDKLGDIDTSNLIFVFTATRKHQLRIPYALFSRESDPYRFVDQNHVNASSEDTVGLIHDVVRTHIECIPRYHKETESNIVVYEPKAAFRSAYNKNPNELESLKLGDESFSGGNFSVFLPRNKLSDWRVGQTLVIVFGTPSTDPPGLLPHPSPSHIHSHPSPNNVSPPPTPPATTAASGPGGGGGSGTSRLNTSANAFFPRGITVRNQEGRELDLGAWRRKDAPASSVVENSTPPIHQTHKKRTTVVRMETVEAKEKRLAEQKEMDEMLRKVYGD